MSDNDLREAIRAASKATDDDEEEEDDDEVEDNEEPAPARVSLGDIRKKLAGK